MKVGSARDTFASQPMAEKDRSEDRSCGRVGVPAFCSWVLADSRMLIV